MIDGTFRQNLEETGMGFSLEVDMVREAKALGMLTTPYAFNVEEARAMAEAGADVLVGESAVGCEDMFKLNQERM